MLDNQDIQEREELLRQEYAERDARIASYNANDTQHNEYIKHLNNKIAEIGLALDLKKQAFQKHCLP